MPDITKWVTTTPLDTPAEDSGDPTFPLAPFKVASLLNELNFFVPRTVSSGVGAALVNANEHLGGRSGPARLYIGLMAGSEMLGAVVYDITHSCFEASDLDPNAAIACIPFGIIVDGGLLGAALRGELQVWELSPFVNEQWYPGDPMDGPLAILFGLLAVRPDLWQLNVMRRTRAVT